MDVGTQERLTGGSLLKIFIFSFFKSYLTFEVNIFNNW